MKNLLSLHVVIEQGNHIEKHVPLPTSILPVSWMRNHLFLGILYVDTSSLAHTRSSFFQAVRSQRTAFN